MSGPKYPPTLQSIGMSVSGESVTTSDLPEPAYWVLPASGPGLMTISFSGSFHFVAGVMACHRYQRPKPRPPTNTSFISSVIAFSLTSRVERLM